MVTAIQIWNPDDWEIFALGLLQNRHGPLNVQKIPAAHKGDWGIDYYCARELVAYQCYAVTEPLDIATRADRQKDKITQDLSKLVRNAAAIGKLFLGQRILHWILLVPVHDSKDLNLHCAKKTIDIRSESCSQLDQSIEVNIHDIASFPGAAINSAFQASKFSLSVEASLEELTHWRSAASPNLLENTHRKLSKRYAGQKLEDAISDTVRAFLEGNMLMDAVRSNSPDLHDNISAALSRRYRRLSIAGPYGGQDVGGILNAELDLLTGAIKAAAPSLSEDNADQIAYGAASDWIMRCPLDFPPYDL